MWRMFEKHDGIVLAKSSDVNSTEMIMYIELNDKTFQPLE